MPPYSKIYGFPCKKKIVLANWKAERAAIRNKKIEMNKLFMNYLVTEGHRGAAENFQKKCGTPLDIDGPSTFNRNAIRIAIQRGNIQAAMDQANELNPLILDKNAELYFHLQKQKLIELIRAGDFTAALDFAKKELALPAAGNPQFLSELECTMALLALEDKSKCPYADLLDQPQRNKTASELKFAIFESQFQGKDPKLLLKLKMMLCGQDKLKDKATFSEMDIEKEVADYLCDAPPLVI